MEMMADGYRKADSSSSAIQSNAARTLRFLQLIEDTIGDLSADTDFFRASQKEIGRWLAQLVQSPPPQEIDPEGRVCDLLTRASEAAARLHAAAEARKAAAMSDPNLNEEDGVVEAFTEYLHAAAALHNTIEDYKDAILTLDAMKSNVWGTFSNVDDLIRALDA